MGLAMSVGLLIGLDGDPEGIEWRKSDLAVINTALSENGLPEHIAPKKIGSQKYRGHISSFPYSYIHYLRRAIAYQINGIALTPADGDPADDPILEEELFMMSSHVICHSDAEGFYLPVDFSEPLFSNDEFFGSCFGVIRELTAVAPSLGITLEGGVLTDAEAKKLADNGEDPLSIEKVSWFTMWEQATYAIQEKAVLVFC